MRAGNVNRWTCLWRTVLLLPALTLPAIGGCHPRLGGSTSAVESTLAPEGDERTLAAAAPPEVEAVAASGGELEQDRLGPGEGTAPLSNFGILTPIFSGVGSDALRAACDPDDFYGGCL